MLPLARQPFDPAWQVHSLGEMIVICSHCHALHWMAESLSRSTNNCIKFGMCCLEGNISLEPLHPAPPELLDFLTHQDPVGNAFRCLIHNYNSALAMTSVGRDVNHSINQDGGGPYTFVLQGQLSHLAGSLLPAEGGSQICSALHL